jgi:plastocyanin
MKPHKRQLSFHKRRLLFLPVLLVLLGPLPFVQGMAGGAESTPTVTAINEPTGGVYNEERHSWSPAAVTVNPGSTVAFTNPGAVPHGIEWINPPSSPTCSSGVPVGNTQAAAGSNWSGTCTFAQNGLYTFYCTVHGAAMQGRVVVTQGQITISQTTTQSSSTAGGTTTTTTTSGALPIESLPGSPLVGSAATAVKLATVQHGKLVHGSVDVAAGGVGGKLEVELLANKAVLASAGHTSQTRVGRLLHSSLTAGIVSFKVPLSAKARRALSKRRRLALTVKLVLTPKQGAAVTVTRHIVLHA